MKRTMLALYLATLPISALADDEATEAFVAANILGIFYHELGHAVIDIESVPIFAQEEDAADVFSIFMIDALFEEESAQSLAYDAAFGFLGEAEIRDRLGEEVSWWSTHGPDEQRFYNTVCIFYGADPQARQAFADDMGLPEDRADYCELEYSQANASWGEVLDEMHRRGGGETILFDGDGDDLTSSILRDEIAAFNAEFSLADTLSVRVEPCGEANAFYDPTETAVIFCSEFEDHLRTIENLFAD